MSIDGGIDFRALVIKWKEKGQAAAFKELIVSSRPEGNPLTWEIPIGTWRDGFASKPTGAVNVEAPKNSGDPAHPGTTFFKQFPPNNTNLNNLTGQTRTYDPTTFKLSTPTPSPPTSPSFNVKPYLPPQFQSPNVGGVLLQAAATGSDGGPAQVGLANGGFSLIVDGQNAQLAPESFQRFVTALWAVYFSRTDPGISIDPIAPDSDKHLVRYIGNKVVGTDLGRVMREADYLMKKWAVGTERPTLQGFKNPDDFAANLGVVNIGAWSRFWFVPEEMKFRQADNTLIFNDGRMVVKTEFMMNNPEGGGRSDAANKKFADYFTNNYNAIKAKYPVYDELFEYAKLASLAKYLKENHVPLLWFLLANKDQVLTEDSPGTVDALTRGSEHFHNVQITGGVDLATKGNYVYDEAARKAIDSARQKLSVQGGAVASDADVARYSPSGFSFDVAKNSYSIVPQHSLTSGRDSRGVRYQTDFALRAEGFELTVNSLETLRPDLMRLEMAGRLQSEEEKIEKTSGVDTGTARIKAEKSLREAFTASQDKVNTVIDRLSSVVNVDYKTEKEFAESVKKSIGQTEMERLGKLIVSRAHYVSDIELVRFFNPQSINEKGDFGQGWRLLIPYSIRPHGTEKKELHNLAVPAAMEVENNLSGEMEILEFSGGRYSKSGILCYVPSESRQSRLAGLFVTSNGAFRLIDKISNEFQFDRSGALTDMVFSEDHNIHIDYLDKMSQSFEKPPYRIEPGSEEKISFANLSMPKSMRVKDLVNGTSEKLVFSDKGKIAGYVPENVDSSRYPILALLSDASFRLLDKGGHEVSFSSAGRFIAMGPGSTEHRPVKALSMGRHKIVFDYTIDNSGNFLIATAKVSKDSPFAEVLHTVRYEYDDHAALMLAKKM